MNEAAITKQVLDLIETIASSPLAGQKPSGTHQGIYHSQSTGGDTPVDGSLDQLRLQVKYLLFDLEATRRENRYLRQMLESRHKRDMDDLKGDSLDT